MPRCPQLPLRPTLLLPLRPLRRQFWLQRRLLPVLQLRRLPVLPPHRMHLPHNKLLSELLHLPLPELHNKLLSELLHFPLPGLRNRQLLPKQPELQMLRLHFRLFPQRFPRRCLLFVLFYR